MKVVWTQTAISHLTDIYEYIAGDSERYALRMVDRITSRTKQISSAPEFGQIVPEYKDTKIRQIIERPYRIIYRVEADRAEVLAVVHGARDNPFVPETKRP